MGTIAEVHGEIAGISNGDMVTEGFISSVHDLGPGSNFTMSARKDFRGNGGSYCLCCDSLTNSAFKRELLNLDREAEELFIRVAIARMNSSLTPSIIFSGLEIGETNQYPWVVEILVNGDTTIDTQNTLRATSTGNIATSDTTWTILEFWIRHSSVSAATDGHVYVYKDFNYGSPWVSWVGRVDRTTSTFDGINTNQILVDVKTLCGIDDMKVQDITLQYTGGAGGSIAVGDIIRVEDGVSTVLGRAEVTNVYGDATSGTLQLREVEDASATAWNGFHADSPFATGVTVIEDGGGGWSASCGDLDKDSGFPGNGYYAAARVPQTLNGGASTPLSYVGGADNVDSVNDGLDTTSETNYVYTVTSTDNDIYDFGALLPVTGDVESIVSTTTYVRVRKDGTGIDNYRIQTKEGANAAVDEDAQTLSADWTVYTRRMRVNPRTDADWTHATLSDTDFGIKFEA